MNRKLKWLVLLITLGGAAGYLCWPTRTTNSPAAVSAKAAPGAKGTQAVTGTLSRNSPPISPAVTATPTLSRFGNANVIESQEMQDSVTREKVVVEIIQTKAKYPFQRVESRL